MTDRTADMSQNTLFPSISNKIADLEYSFKKFRRNNPDARVPLEHVPLVGTVKLDGTHGDIIINADNSISFQSHHVKNITPEKDNCGFAAFAASQTSTILALKEKYYAIFRSLNPTDPIDPSYPLILAGEWVGPGIQKGVALNRLPQKIFVICLVSVNGTWLPNDTVYSDIHAEEDGIYNISRSDFFYHSLSLTDIGSSEQMLQEFAHAAEDSCPFAQTFGINGRGEGFVYRAAPPYPQNEDFWLKVKGPLHKLRGGSNLLKDVASNLEEKEKVALLAEEVTSESQLEQGWEILREMHMKRSPTDLVQFREWVSEEVKKEEWKDIESQGVSWKMLKRAVEGRATAWYVKKVKGERGEGEEMPGPSKASKKKKKSTEKKTMLKD